jgi:beta-phosphoglucomutase-like phosphatase (HAD superfamily)
MATGFEGAIFDVDGVLVDSPHERAWKESLREPVETDWADLRDQTMWTDEGFTPQVYQQVISGKPRAAGALAALEYSGVPDAKDRVEEYSAHKLNLVIDDVDIDLLGRHELARRAP